MGNPAASVQRRIEAASTYAVSHGLSLMPESVEAAHNGTLPFVFQAKGIQAVVVALLRGEVDLPAGDRSEQVRRVDVHLAGGDVPVRVSSVELQSRPLPGMEAALFVHEGDLLTALQGLELHDDTGDPQDVGYMNALRDVRELLRGSRIDLEEGKD